MNTDLLNFILFPIFNIVILLCILGFGNLFNKIIKINKDNLDLKNLIFIQGLIFVGLISILINFFFPISDLITSMIIIVGLLLYSKNFFEVKTKKNEIFFILFILIFSFCYAFYAGVSDDYNYHFETIKNFKNKNLYEILHHRTISYNSHWLFLTSIFYVSFLKYSLFILTSLFFSIFIFDLLKLSLKITYKKQHYLSIISFFILIFFLGILNKYKDLGTDVPGVIVNIYILIIILNFFINKNFEIININFLFLLLLGYFAFIIKITNVLVFLFLIFLFMKLDNKKFNIGMIFIVSLFPLPWIYQNLIISGCLIWPISITCFANISAAVSETYLIESFAKGDISTSIEVKKFSWIKIWFLNHFYKLIETYFVYLLILSSPVIYFLYKKRKSNRKAITLNILKEIYLDFNYGYILIITCICNVIWFLYAPAYRFGIFYNLTLIIIIFFPLWVLILKKDFNFIINYSKTIFVLICIYFLFENINKIEWYNKRYYIWPPFVKEELLNRSKF